MEIKVNGKAVKVLNSRSAGPGCTPREYDIPGGYVRNVGSEWMLHRTGQWPQKVEVQV